MKIIIVGCWSADTPVLLKHLLNHQRDFEIDCYLIALHSYQAKSENRERTLEILRSYKIEPALEWRKPFNSWRKTEIIQKLIQSNTSYEDWIIPTDLDEFHNLPDQLREYLANLDKLGINHIQGNLIDRISIDGRLTQLLEEPEISKQYPLCCKITQTIAKGWNVKLVAHKSYLKHTVGHHYLIEEERDIHLQRRHKELLDVNHYKWDSSVVERLKVRISNFREQNNQDYKESEAILQFLEEHQMRFPPEDTLVQGHPPSSL